MPLCWFMTFQIVRLLQMLKIGSKKLKWMQEIFQLFSLVTPSYLHPHRQQMWSWRQKTSEFRRRSSICWWVWTTINCIKIFYLKYISFYETSAKESINVKEAYSELISKLVQTFSYEGWINELPRKIKANEKSEPLVKWRC